MSSAPVRSALLDVLTRDALVLLYFAVAITEGLIYSLPLLDPGTLTAFGASPFQIPFVATAAMAGFYGLSRVESAEERLFWRILTYACVFWVATLVAIALVPQGEWRWVDDLWADAAYLFFYSPILFAAECTPHLADIGPRRDMERQLRWTGVTLLVSGWFLYFVVAPAVTDPALFGTMLPSSLLFITIDGAVILRFAWRAYTGGSTRWQVLYGLLALTGASLLLTDTLDLAEALGWFALPDGATTDLLWAIPPFFLLLAFRLREAPLSRSADRTAGPREAITGLEPVRVGIFLVAGAFSFPLAHFAVHAWLPFNERLVAFQQGIVVVELLALGSLAVAAFLYLERQRVAAEHRRAALAERVQRARALEAVSRLAGAVADQTAGTFRALGGFADRALDSLATGDPLRTEARKAAEHAHRGLEFVQGLRAISRQDRGRPEPVDLGAAVADLIPQVLQTVGPTVLVEHVARRETAATPIDPAHLRAIVLDLATNARGALSNGGHFRLETGVVDLDADASLGLAMRPGRYARLLARNSGSGIPKELLPHLFEPFFSTMSGEGSGGGLGLATLYALVSQYGGCVSVTSEPGNTTFDILLPASR